MRAPHVNDRIGLTVVTNPCQLVFNDGPLSPCSTHQINLNWSFRAFCGVNRGMSYLGMTGYLMRSFVCEIGGGFGGSP